MARRKNGGKTAVVSTGKQASRGWSAIGIRGARSHETACRGQTLAEYGITLGAFAGAAVLLFRFVLTALSAMRSGVLDAAVRTGEFF